ncbi:hypothetical protein EGT74_06345 [Chitinophaga lutea]|uniref:Uncharacterized protein n=2 Tax=Chitinophaga lutea TaxID=2488634 RepID=A0A3N4QAY4_9BACT|nr:hypothetical protein EGT74_06345 [Chitinophaga lutea]
MNEQGKSCEDQPPCDNFCKAFPELGAQLLAVATELLYARSVSTVKARPAYPVVNEDAQTGQQQSDNAIDD